MTDQPRAPENRAWTSVGELVAGRLVAPEQEAVLQQVAEGFRIRVSAPMRAAIAAADDPIGRQFLPDEAELVIRADELADPIGDQVHSPVKGLTHRYPDRVILAVTQSCEVYCRFCFRRETVGGDGALSDEELDAALEYIRGRPAIWEVILTGGDPLVLSPRRIAALMAGLARIGHVQIVRIHTRVPVVAPARISAALIAALRGFPVVYVVVHTNHVREIGVEAQGALARLVSAGIPLLAQTVLLRGVNDDAAVLEDLFRSLVRNRVTPYYLHHCDLARGTGHFRTTIAEGQRIMAALRGRLSGICLPTYVLDIPQGFGKVPIGPAYVEGLGGGSFLVTDYQGGVHRYDDPAS